MKIAVIEDSKTINKMIKLELQKHNHEISSAYTLKEAQELFKKNHFELIILDLHLPDAEGSELIAQIQTSCKAKIIVLTAYQRDDLREELFAYGVLDYIIKDANLLYSIHEIIRVIERIETNHEKVLVIDDSKFICSHIKQVLTPRNYHVTAAYDAKSALKELEREDDFKLIILDMELPDMHGMELLKLIRNDMNYIDTPVIVLSGTATAEIIRDILKNGANDYIKKPFVNEEFLLRIDLWIDIFKKEELLKEQKAQLEHYNKHLHELVLEEVEKNRQKDRLLLMQTKQAQMGEMIAMIAHQWRQPLNAIATSLGMIELKTKSNECQSELITKITAKMKQTITYLSNTIDDFRNFFRPDKEAKETSFETIFTKSLVLIESSLSAKGITLDFEIKSQKIFYGYENELIQVVINLLKNSMDALSQKRVQNPTITVTIDDLCITIADNAGGIAPEILDKIFDPYFSTKDEKEGTGLGLYMSKIIVEEHSKGSLRVTNKDGGACFDVCVKDLRECT